MIFNEIYSAYYNAVAKIIAAVMDGERNTKKLEKIISDTAFGESALTILPALHSGRWQLFETDMSTTLENLPTMPLTTLEKMWLKAISLDKRVKLFGVELEGLDGVEPLFTEDDYRIYDRYSDGDPYDDEGYVLRFKIILDAIKNGDTLNVEYINRYDEKVLARFIPTKLEYSEKDDKFRVFTKGCRYVSVINLAKIVKCRVYVGDKQLKNVEKKSKTNSVLLEITDYRNALERVMLHFAHFEKQAECIGERKYCLRVFYDANDEQEMVIRILSFGQLVKVIEPEPFKCLIIEKLKKQRSCGL